MRDPFHDLPGWVAAIAGRLVVFSRGLPGARRRRRDLRRVLRDLRGRIAAAGDAAALDALGDAALRLTESGVAARPDLAAFRGAVARLCALARAELAAGRDDRPLLAAMEVEQAAHPGMPWPLVALPGRVVFLAAMEPAMRAEAAVMMVNDLAALGEDLPLVALAAAARGG
jgi:hypothetical protein